jgi:hypothetical protein
VYAGNTGTLATVNVVAASVAIATAMYIAVVVKRETAQIVWRKLTNE